MKWSAILLAVYFLAACVAEFDFRRAVLRDETPLCNRVCVELRYLPPLTRAVDRAGVERFFLLGSDNLGRDVFSRLLQGARIAFRIGVVTSLLAVPFGTLLGLLAGYFGRRTDAILSALAAAVASIPSLLLILAISLLVGKGLAGVYVGVAATTWVGVFRIVRTETQKIRSRGYVLAARELGYSAPRILFRHILPNVFHLVLISFSLRFPAAVGTEVFLSFLGLGAQGEPSWGVSIANARVRLWQGVWWEGAFTTLAVFGLILAANRFGDALRDKLDPTGGSSRAS